jgi:hypothetical protein
MKTNRLAKEINPENTISLSPKEYVTKHLVVFFLSTIVMGFIAGFVAYSKIVEISGEVLVGKDSYILKKDLVGTILKSEAISEIDHLIEIGQKIYKNDDDTRIWLMRVMGFIHGLNLEKDTNWNGTKMSSIEADIRYALTDTSLENQRQKTLGVLLGFRSAFQTSVTSP